MMKLHHYLSILLVTFLFILSAVADEDADYDQGFIEHEKLPKPEHRVAPEHPQKVHEELKKAENDIFDSFSWSEASFYIPVAIISGVLLNAIIISILVVMKRRRVTAYRKMQLERSTPVFQELHSEI